LGCEIIDQRAQNRSHGSRARRVIDSQIGLDSLASLPMKCFATSQAHGQEFQAIYLSPAWLI
jgi:hypothetical protein